MSKRSSKSESEALTVAAELAELAQFDASRLEEGPELVAAHRANLQRCLEQAVSVLAEAGSRGRLAPSGGRSDPRLPELAEILAEDARNWRSLAHLAEVAERVVKQLADV